MNGKYMRIEFMPTPKQLLSIIDCDMGLIIVANRRFYTVVVDDEATALSFVLADIPILRSYGSEYEAWDIKKSQKITNMWVDKNNTVVSLVAKKLSYMKIRTL